MIDHNVFNNHFDYFNTFNGGVNYSTYSILTFHTYDLSGFSRMVGYDNSSTLVNKSTRLAYYFSSYGNDSTTVYRFSLTFHTFLGRYKNYEISFVWISYSNLTWNETVHLT